MTELVFLKLGGSLITDKNTAHTARLDVIERISTEIVRGLKRYPDMRLLIGHGSGSFGHMAARKYGTRDGVFTTEGWLGFAEVWNEAKALNQVVMDQLVKAGIPAIAFPPCAQVKTRSHDIIEWNTSQLAATLANQLTPVIYGDVVFDDEIGGTILSTEEQFEFLSSVLRPARILLAGVEAGIWKDFPKRKEFYPLITPENIKEVKAHLAPSESPDVTGGMVSKVESMLRLVEDGRCREVCIFSGLEADRIFETLGGACNGTIIRLN